MNELKGLVLLTGCIVLSCCAKPEVSTSKIPAASLKYASAVYSKFESELRNDPKDNDFVKFASDPRNYNTTIVTGSHSVTFIFTLNPYHGRRALDGRIKYRVSESGKIELDGKL